MIYFTAHTFKCVCHCIRTMFRVLGVYNFDQNVKSICEKLKTKGLMLFVSSDLQDLKFGASFLY